MNENLLKVTAVLLFFSWYLEGILWIFHEPCLNTTKICSITSLFYSAFNPQPIADWRAKMLCTFPVPRSWQQSVLAPTFTHTNHQEMWAFKVFAFPLGKSEWTYPVAKACLKMFPFPQVGYVRVSWKVHIDLKQNLHKKNGQISSTLSPIIMFQCKRVGFLKGNNFWWYTHVSLNHDYGSKSEL